MTWEKRSIGGDWPPLDPPPPQVPRQVFATPGPAEVDVVVAVGPDELFITPFSPNSLGIELGTMNADPDAANTWPTANAAFYYPFRLYSSATVLKMFWQNGSVASGNVDVGIYDEDGALQVSIGSTAQGTINVLQEVDVTDTTLVAGLYYLAGAMDNITGRIESLDGTTITAAALNVFGVRYETSAFPLPATATMAELASTEEHVPVIGLSVRSIVT